MIRMEILEKETPEIRMEILEKETPEIRMEILEKETPEKMSVHEGVGRMVVKKAEFYGDLEGKPSLNGVVIDGKLSFEDVGIRPIPLSDISNMFKGW